MIWLAIVVNGQLCNVNNVAPQWDDSWCVPLLLPPLAEENGAVAAQRQRGTFGRKALKYFAYLWGVFMLKTFLKTSAATVAALIAIAPASAAVLVANTGWQSDTLSVAGLPTSNSPWTFTVATSAVLSVTDAFITGDTYTLSGDVAGVTTLFAGGGVQADGTTFGLAWANPVYGKIAINVGPGNYAFSITGDGAGGLPAGLGVRLDTAVPEPMTWAMMVVGLGVVGASMRRRKLSTNVSFS